jgi:hypothetical protein
MRLRNKQLSLHTVKPHVVIAWSSHIILADNSGLLANSKNLVSIRKAPNCSDKGTSIDDHGSRAVESTLDGMPCDELSEIALNGD